MKTTRNRIAAAWLATSVVLGGGLACAPALAEDAFVCMEETQAICDQKNQNLATFIKAHEAYDRGRETGDLSEAYALAKELVANDDAKHGKGILRQIYIQAALGTHKNYVQAYRWVAEDIAAGTTYKQLKMDKILEAIAQKMTPEQLAEAKK